jgi:hypothetical protein
MSATTRSLGYNYLLKYWSANPTCTACSADADAIRFTAGTCTTIGGMDNFDLGGAKEMFDVTSFEDTMNKNVPGRVNFDPINLAGNYDPGDAAQKVMVGQILHEGVVASTNTIYVFSATDTVNKRKHSWKGYITSAKITAGVKNKATFAMTILPMSKVQVCTTA